MTFTTDDPEASSEEDRWGGTVERGASAPENQLQVSPHFGAKVRPRFRYVSVLTAEVSKRISAHANRIGLKLGGDLFSVTLASGLARPSGEDVFAVRIGGQAFQVEVERLWDLLSVPASWWDSTPGGLRAELLADLLRASGAVAVEVMHVGVDGAMTEPEMSAQMCFTIERERDRSPVRACLRFQNSAAGGLLASVWEKAERLGEVSLPNLSLPVRVELHSTRLGGAELTRLRPGALVPIGDPLEGRDVLVSIGWGEKLVAPAVIGDGVVTLQGEVSKMSEAKAGTSGVSLSELSRMGDIEVQFTVELATCSLPLSELGRLGPGSTLNLGLPHEPSLVRLCVNGKPVATGELVVLGQSLGVQVVEVSSA